MPGGKHALVKDADDENAFCRLAIEDDVAALLNAAEVWTEWTKNSAHTGSLSKTHAKYSDSVEIKIGLRVSPCIGCVVVDRLQICFGMFRECDFRQRLSTFVSIFFA